jgi:hypothetical protein
MNSHRKARTSLQGPVLPMSAFCCIQTDAGETAGASVRTARNWRQRLVTDGHSRQGDRRSRPQETPSTVDPDLRKRIEQLRRGLMLMRFIPRIDGHIGTMSVGCCLRE